MVALSRQRTYRRRLAALCLGCGLYLPWRGPEICPDRCERGDWTRRRMVKRRGYTCSICEWIFASFTEWQEHLC